MNRSDGVSRRTMFGAFFAAALAPWTAKARAALGWSRGPALCEDDATDATAHDTSQAVTTYVYDRHGRLVNIIEPCAGEVASWTYDEIGEWQ